MGRKKDGLTKAQEVGYNKALRRYKRWKYQLIQAGQYQHEGGNPKLDGIIQLDYLSPDGKHVSVFVNRLGEIEVV